MASLLNSYNRGGWNYYSNFGVWVFDYISGRWCFLPFGRGWGSPYGYSYWFNFDDCRMPWYVYTTPPNTTTPTAPTTPTGPTSAQIREQRREDMHTPTFQRFEGTQRNESRGGGGGSNDNRDDNGGGGWNNSRRNDSDSRNNNDTRNNDTRNDTRNNDTRSNDTKTYDTPSMPSSPAPATPIIVVPTETKSTKDN
jgi:hypothetical protein